MLAIIPARGGSKRIPGKNIRHFLGHPVIEYSIRAAIESGCFSEVMVSTDSEEIAEAARRAGASVPFMRSERTSDDFATTADVVREVLDTYASAGQEFEAFAVIYATAPFITPDTLRRGRQMLLDGFKAAFTCVEYSYPIQRPLVINDGCVSMREPEHLNSRSQDLPKSYHDAGQCYFSSTAAFRDCGSLWGPDTAPIILSDLEVQDIDTPIDWKLAELKYRLLHEDDSVVPHDVAIPETVNERGSVLARIPLQVGPFTLVPYQDLSHELSELMRKGRNLPEVRERMLNPGIIDEDSHSRFVESLKHDPDKAYLALFCSDGNGESPAPIGSVTLTRLSADDLERGIWLFPEAQGFGYARSFLSLLYEKLDQAGFKRIFTRVKADNAPSNALEAYLMAEPISGNELPEKFLPQDNDLQYYVARF